MSDERTMVLWSSGLLSRFGFNDGDEPDDVLDWLEADGMDYLNLDWHPVLVRLVREFLLPALDQTVEVYEIGTIHNPIRARTVDGIKVDNKTGMGLKGEEILLTPESVSVPYEAILRCMETT